MTKISAGGGDYQGLPTKPIQHRGRQLPVGLPWAEITEQYVANNGQLDPTVWHKGKVQVVEAGRRGSDRVHTFAIDDQYEETAAPAPKHGARHRRTVAPDSTPVTAVAAKPRVTLTDTQRAEIAKRYVDGEHMPELAEAYGVGVGSVSWALKVHGVKPRSQAEARRLAKTRSVS